MNEKIQRYVDDIFKDVPQKRRIAEIREELLSNMCEKYEDLISQGKSEEEAYSIVVSGIGDIASLIDDVVEVDRQSFTKTAIKNKHSFIKKKYLKEDDSFAEEYKEKISMSDKTSRISAAIISALWPLIVLIYFIASFSSDRWDVTWVIFIIGAVIQLAITSIINKKLKVGGIIWTSAVVLYFVISFSMNNWEYSWLIFLAAAAVQQIVRVYNIWRES
ncbi:MAG: permease prefix domain 1-containing protein [Bacillota bacterium]|nr:permease prefix domain 1-containing protein [Bacillota bacterium]